MDNAQTYYLIQQDNGSSGVSYLTSDGKFSSNQYIAREFTKHQTASLHLKRLQALTTKPGALTIVEA